MPEVSFKVDLSPLAEYKPYEGVGASELFTHDGEFLFKLKEAKPQMSTDGKPMLLVVLTVQDEDNKGRQTLHNVLLGGKDKNGDPLIRQLGDLLTGMGLPVETITAFAKNGTIDVQQLVATIIDKDVTATVEAQEYDGKLSSRVRNFIAPTKYQTAKASGSYRRNIRATQTLAGKVNTAAAMPNIAAATPTAPAVQAPLFGGTAQPANGAKAADPLANLGGGLLGR